MSPSLSPGEIFEARVRGLSAEGHGVVNHPSGAVFFVPASWPGDEGRFVIESFAKKYGYARLAELTEPSPDRVAAPCSLQGSGPGRCGGCAWMIGSYASQLRHKEERLKHALSRAGLIGEDDGVLRPIWASEREWNYRNRAQFKSDGARLGFVAEASHELVDVPDCLVLNEEMRGRLKALRGTLPNPAFQPSAGKKFSFIECDDETPVEDCALPNRRRPFRQANEAQNTRMKQWLRAGLETLPRQAPLLELFCGSGNLTEVAVEVGFESITAIEVVAEALQRLVERGWPRVEGVKCDLFKSENWHILGKKRAETQVLVLDPPRDGADGVEKLVRYMPGLRQIFYISCDVATFVRDCGRLQRAGFALKEVQPLDMFPQTPHIEVLARLSRS